MSIESEIAAAVRDVVTDSLRAALTQPHLAIPAAYTVPDAAETLGCHPVTLRTEIASGRIPTFNVGGNRGVRIPGWWVHGLPAPATVLELASTPSPLREVS
ncbi:MAG: helix-turn-helix domain-containing protein [Actinobacteria bacterium]|nr:helix-turn-helix domain-containing protein [Actinomycetota bacterium]